MKLMVLDGNSIVNRAFYGIRMLNAPDGTPTNGIYGFISILQRLLDEEKPDGVCAAFDLKAPTFRHLQYDGYKAQRKGMPEELAVQMPLLKDTLDAMGILRVELEGYEADDLIGTISRRCEDFGDECVIVTGDKDSFQLITGKTHVLHVKSRMGQTETVDYTVERFKEEYGLEPAGMIDLKSLMGDSSDNIPGVAGIGEKTALQLLHSFGSLRGIYENIESSEIKAGVRAKLLDGREAAEMSYSLATIVTDAPMEFTPADAKWNFDFKPELYRIFMRLGFTKFIEKYKLSPSEGSASADEIPEALPVTDISGSADLNELRSRLAGMRPVSVVTSDGLDSVSICDENAVYNISWSTAGDGYNDFLRELFSGEVIAHNAKDLIRLLMDEALPADSFIFDTALAAYLLDATASDYSLPKLSVKYLGCESDGAECIRRLYPVLDEKLRSLGMEKLMYDIELPLCNVLADMERTGFLVDRQALYDYGQSLTGGIDSLQRSIWDAAGEQFNINSPKQLGTVLFEKLMLPAGKKTKTGWSTNADVLEKLRGKHPIIQQILDYRELSKLKSTYADGLLKVIAPDGRIHTSFQMTVTATGRLSSTEPNLQNIPVRRELGSEIRKMFVAGPGKMLVDADYSQIELRLLAHISGDETMRRAFINSEDIHAVTASQVFGIPLEDVTPVMRSRAKAVNFGIVYGISAFSLSQDIGVWPNEAKEYIDTYFSRYSGVREYMEKTIAGAKETGYAVTLYGRRRYLPELKASNFNMRSFGERVARNMPIQGTAADIMKIAMINVFRRLKEEGLEAKLILQVHDELIVECPEAEAEKVADILRCEMGAAAELSVPLTADAKCGKSWADAK